MEALDISPYIREGSGLKQQSSRRSTATKTISPYIREGSGLKLLPTRTNTAVTQDLPLHP